MSNYEFSRGQREFYRALKLHQSAIQTLGAPAVHQSDIAAARAWVESRTPHIDHERKQYRDEYNRGYENWHGVIPGGDPTPSAPLLCPWRAGSWLLLVAAIVIAAWIGTRMLMLPVIPNAFLSGILFALALHFSIKAALLLRTDRNRKPRAALREVQQIIQWFGGGWLTALMGTTIYVLRGPEDASVYNIGFGVLVTLLLVLSCALGAALAAAQSIRSWGNVSAQRWLALQRQSSLLEELEQECGCPSTGLTKMSRHNALPESDRL